jgi:Rrf2 family protein
MKVSMKVDYGVRALIDLVQHYGQGAVQTSEIAQRQAIPEPYLDQLLTSLRKAGYIRSRRGPQGGHVLIKEPTQITLADVITTLEGHNPPIDCLDGSMECSLAATCAQQDIWRQVDLLTQSFLNSTTILDLAMKQKRQEKRVMYYI